MPGPWQIQLPSGEHNLLVGRSIKENRTQLQIQLDGQLLREIAVPTGYQCSGYSHTVGAVQLNLDREQLDTFLTLNLTHQDETDQRLEFHLWPSTHPKNEGISALAESASNTEKSQRSVQ